MATTDQQDQLDPSFYEGVNFLGRPTSISLMGQEPNTPATGLAAGGAPVSAASAPAGSGGAPDLSGSSPTSSPIASLLQQTPDRIKDLANLFSGPPTRGDVGGPGTPQNADTSLSDQLRSTPGLADASGGILSINPPPPTFTPGFIGPGIDLTQVPTSGTLIEPGTGEVIGGFGAGGAATAPEIGADLGASVGSGAGEAVAAAAPQAAVGALEGSLYAGAPQVAVQLWDTINTYFKDKARADSIVQAIKGDVKGVGTVLPQLAAAAVDPSTIGNLSKDDLSQLYTNAFNAYGASSGLANPFSMSGKSKMGIQFPDFSQAIDVARNVEPVDFFNLIASYDALAKQGATPDQALPFSEALHIGNILGGAQPFGGINELSAWDPYYKNQPVVPSGPAPEGVFDPNPMRAASSPQEYLSAIGADPSLAAKIQPLIDSAKPGQYLDTLSKILALVNPEFAASQFGSLLARSGGGGTPAAAPAEMTAAPTTTGGGGLFDTPPAIAGGLPSDLQLV